MIIICNTLLMDELIIKRDYIMQHIAQLKEKINVLMKEKEKYDKLISELCEHEWEIDRTTFDPCKTYDMCKKCFIYR